MFYRVLPSFTEFYRVLPSFTEFYRVLPEKKGKKIEISYRVSTSTCINNQFVFFTEFYRVSGSQGRDGGSIIVVWIGFGFYCAGVCLLAVGNKSINRPIQSSD